jgi:hypothetical protein
MALSPGLGLALATSSRSSRSMTALQPTSEIGALGHLGRGTTTKGLQMGRTEDHVDAGPLLRDVIAVRRGIAWAVMLAIATVSQAGFGSEPPRAAL